MSARKRWVVPALLAALPALALMEMAMGPSGLGLAALLEGLAHPGSAPWRVALYVRLPRTLCACMAGCALAASGTVLQTVLGNPLASPGVVGVNAGAGLMALAAMLWWPGAALAVPAFAFLGALGAAALVLAVSAWVGGGRGALILTGVAVSSLLTALTECLVTLFPDAAADRAFFAAGSFASAGSDDLLAVLPFLTAGILAALLLEKEMRVLSLGDERARALGQRPAVARLALVAVAALLAGCGVSLAGLLGFVGLIVPNLCRALAGGNPRLRMPLGCLMGAELCMLCDLIARTLFRPYEIPVGVALAILGAPFFLIILKRQRERRNAEA